MKQDTRKETTIEHTYKPGRLALVALLLLITTVSAVTPSAAADQKAAAITLAGLKGSWTAAIVGNTGCGLGTMYVTFTLDAFGHGSGTATIVGHAQCGDSTASGLDFNINSLNNNGSGTANLSCGVGCGWDLNIQVAKNSQVFNLVDVSPANPNNYIAGTAIRH